MAEVAGTVLNADSREDPGVIVQHLGEERGRGLIAAKPFVKGQTIIREKVINNSIHSMNITILNSFCPLNTIKTIIFQSITYSQLYLHNIHGTHLQDIEHATFAWNLLKQRKKMFHV